MHEKRDEIDMNVLSSNIVARTGYNALKTSLTRTCQRVQEEKNMAPEIQGVPSLNMQERKFSFLEGLLGSSNHIKEKLLNEYRDKRLPEVIPVLKHLQFIPIWSYVHHIEPSFLIEGQ